jgi:hypothetical protein
VLEALGVDYIDESEVLTPADDKYHIDKQKFKVPFVCGARDLGEALRRIAEGAAMIRSKGEAGSGNIVEAVRHMRAIRDAIAELSVAPEEELVVRARDIGAPLELVRGSRARSAAGRAVLRGRRLDAGRRCAHDAARRGGDLRRQRHLQGGGDRRQERRPLDDENGFPKSIRTSRCATRARSSRDDALRGPAGGRRGAQVARRRAPMHGLDVRAAREKQLLALRGN